MALQVSDRFSVAHREAVERYVVEIELVDERCQVVGQSVEVIAPPRIGGPSMAPTVIGDAAQALVDQLGELVLPDVRIETPGMGEEHRLAGAPIDVEQARTVVGLDKGRPRSACHSLSLRRLGGGRPDAGGNKGGGGRRSERL